MPIDLDQFAAAAAAKLLQSCPTLSDPMDCSPPGSSIHGVFQARTLEWGAIAFSSYYMLMSPFNCKEMSQSYRNSILNIHWKDWCWSWSSNTLATWCGELTHWKRPWCWEGLRAGGEGDNRRRDGWMASPTRCMWVWVNCMSSWWMGKPGVLQSMGSQRVRHDWETELNRTELMVALRGNTERGNIMQNKATINQEQLRAAPGTTSTVLTSTVFHKSKQSQDLPKLRNIEK